MSISGNTIIYGVIGDPVSHSLSPQIHKYFADLTNINMAYVPFHVKNEDIPDALKGAHALGIKGINITVPHKQAVMPFLAGIDPMAKRIGAVNTLIWAEDGYIGYNTDYIGIQKVVSAAGLSFKGCNVTILGAGGSAYAACVAAADQNASSITIINRSQDNAQLLASQLKSHYNIPVNFSGEFGEIVIQTTTVGFNQLADKSPVADVSLFKNVQLAFDIIYTPPITVFMRQATDFGVPKVVGGFHMLVYQAAAAFDLWHDKAVLQNEDIICELEKRLHFN